jgi:hypothetical protein
MPCVAPLAAVSIVWMRSILPIKGGLLTWCSRSWA